MTRVVRLGTMNNDFQHVEVLKRNRTRRHQYGECFVEGVRPIQRLVDAGWPVHSVWSDADRPLSGWAEGIVRASGAERHYRLAPELMERLSDREEPSELVLVAGLRRRSLADLDLSADFLAIVLDRPSSPGNIGTVVRSAAALGAGAVIVSGHAADPFDPRAIRASTGAVFAVPVVEARGPADVAAWLETRGPALVLGTDSAAQRHVREVDLRGPTVIVVGNENAGLSYRFQELCTDTVTVVPHSLNMAVATSILLYEAAIQRGHLGAQ